MAKLSAEDRLAKWLKNHPNASQKKFDKFLKGHAEIAGLFVPPPADPPSPAPATPDPTPPAETGIDHPADPPPTAVAPDDRTPWQKAFAWIKANPISITADPAYAPLYEKFNLGIWAGAAALVLWMILRKKKS